MVEPPKRKPNRLADWNYSQNGFYFITINTRNYAHLLGRVVRGGVLDAPQMQLSAIGQAVHDQILKMNEFYSHVSVANFCVMHNHIHLLLAVENGTPGTSSRTNEIIPAFVSTLKRYVNRVFCAQLWHRSYYDHIIRNDADFQRIWTYIDTNPQKWETDIYFHRGT